MMGAIEVLLLAYKFVVV